MEKREIKFRFWSEEEKTMIDWEDVASSKVGMMIGGNKGKNKKWEVVPMQYTGLKDKNGKEIYEGDLIKFLPNGYEPREIYQIIWDENNLSWGIFRKYEKFSSMSPLESASKDFTIIGNIYQNPELIK